MHDQENAVKEWLKQVLGSGDFSLSPLNGDASFRHYFRLNHAGLSQIVMDATAEKASLTSFIKVNHLLTAQNLLTPKIHAADQELGLALLDDFGDSLLLDALAVHNIEVYYQKAIRSLFILQETEATLPKFDQDFMLGELKLFTHWFLALYLKIEVSPTEKKLIEERFLWLVNEIAQQPKVMIHRDYHSRNLMIVGDSLGIIDFQDAMLGPFTYDLVSLLKDCYIKCPDESLEHSLKFFYTHSTLAQLDSYDRFCRAFDLAGLQRHLKVLGIFSRLYLRDHKAAYLAHLPLILHYVQSCLETYEELHPLSEFFQTRIKLS